VQSIEEKPDSLSKSSISRESTRPAEASRRLESQAEEEPDDLSDMEKENIVLFHELMERIRNTTGTFRHTPEVQVSPIHTVVEETVTHLF
jgi:hypothetical protein